MKDSVEQSLLTLICDTKVSLPWTRLLLLCGLVRICRNLLERKISPFFFKCIILCWPSPCGYRAFSLPAWLSRDLTEVQRSSLPWDCTGTAVFVLHILKRLFVSLLEGRWEGQVKHAAMMLGVVVLLAFYWTLNWPNCDGWSTTAVTQLHISRAERVVSRHWYVPVRMLMKHICEYQMCVGETVWPFAPAHVWHAPVSTINKQQ